MSMIPENIQALIAAFSFGILVNAASAGLVLYIKGHGSAIFRDGLRLALIIFLASSALWAQVEFISTVIDPSAPSACQATAIFSSLFDQFARVSIEQYLLWATGQGQRLATGIVLQVLLVVRFIMGMVFVGVTRQQFNPTCVPVSSVVPVAIVVIAMDAVILAILALQTFSSGSKRNSAVMLILTGLAIWMGTSVTLLLGFSTIDLLFKTTIPAVGLSILVALVTVFFGTLIFPQERRTQRPNSPTPQNMSMDRDLLTADANEYPPSRYEDVKGINTMSAYATQNVPTREAPTAENNKNVRTIGGPMPVAIGVGGLPIQGQLFPPMRPIEESKTWPTPQDGKRKFEIKNKKRSILERSKRGSPASKITVGKLAISNPIVAETADMQSSLNKIQTIDLATAAQNEKDRRAAQRPPTLVAQRPAPQPPSVSRDDGLKRAVSSKRKEVGEQPMSEPLRSNSVKSSQGLSVEGNASSSSAQLSPGSEELRRRSPRQAQAEAVPTKSKTFTPVTPGQPIRIPIPRPPADPEALPAKTPEPIKTPLQRKPTIGLPNNPRAKSMKLVAPSTGNQRSQTVMFINNITYDDPSVVDNIIQGASKTPSSPLKSSKSVVHRARPIPRKSDKDRQVFPSEFSPNHGGQGHRRSKSSGSIRNRKSMLESSVLSSPKQLPPLPPPPMSAGKAFRPQPNDTKSMTFDEKMALLYESQSAPSSATTTSKRRSSVPEIPSVPTTFLVDNSDNNDVDGGRRQTKTTVTDRSSVQTQSILGLEDSKRDMETYTCDVSNELGNSWLPDIAMNNGATQSRHLEGMKRQSSPVLGISRFSATSYGTDANHQDELTTTNWGSVHSPVAPFNINESRLNARAIEIQKDSYLAPPVGRPPIPSNLSGFGNEVMTVMLDTSSEHSMGTNDNRQSFYIKGNEKADNNRQSFYMEGSEKGEKANDYRQSFYLEGSEKDSKSPAQEAHDVNGWHHRVGEDLPTFSTRREKMRSRKGPPPTPLLLKGAGSTRAVVVQPAEPSPLESPDAAYKMIQDQLQKFEQPSRDSIESVGKRLALLENLEMEIGQQENKWQTMQHNLARDSMTSLQTSPAGSRPNSTADILSRRSPTKSIAEKRRASRLGRMSRSGDGASSHGPSSSGSESNPVSLFQSRLAKAQSTYMENAPDLIMKRNKLNFLSVSKAELGSPSPPETDESESELEPELPTLAAKVFQPAPKVIHLWKRSPPIQVPRGALWVAPAKQQPDIFTVQLPGLPVRPAIRKAAEPLEIESSHMWQKPVPAKSNQSGDLWRNATPQEIEIPQQRQKTPARPLTQRPPRRNKRVTLLPDIVESPQPLPDKRDTLGIFQFPWGERSENATVQPRPTMYMAMPGTMSSGVPRRNATLEARARQIEATEYSSSFFDDYDEEEGDNFDYSDSEGDDFDETTLWEIASLLKTEQTVIPSKNSLLPGGAISASALQDYIDEMASEEDELAEYDTGLNDFDVMPEEPVPSTPLPAASPAAPTLWVANDFAEESSKGLPQPDGAEWEMYIPRDAGRVRSGVHVEEIASIESSDLWTPENPELPVNRGLPQPDGVWERYVPGRVQSQEPAEEMLPVEGANLWTSKLDRPERSLSPGLPQPDDAEWEQYISSDIGRVRSQVRIEEVPSIESRDLWMPRVEQSEQISSPLWSAPQSPRIELSTDSSRATLRKPADVSNVSQFNIDVQAAPMMWKQPTTKHHVQLDGLFDPNYKRADFRRTWKLPAALSTKRSPRTSQEPLSQLTTQELWNMTRESVAEPETAVSDLHVHVEIEEASPVLMWEQPVSQPDTEVAGLFDANTYRSDFRRTSKPPAALSTMRSPRVSQGPLAQLTTRDLWGLMTESDDERLVNPALMWSNPFASRRHNPTLFKLDPERKEYRTTSHEPAALRMISKPRVGSDPIPQLESTQLWTATISLVEHDWMTIYSVRPQSPSVPSVAPTRSSLSSPLTDTSSVRTNITKASTVAKSTRNGFRIRGFFSREKAESEPEPVSELPEEPEDFVVRNLDETPSTPQEITPAPLRRQYRQPVIYREDWDAALQEAIIASYPSTSSVPSSASQDQWDEALEQAINASHMAPKISRRTASPREWSTALFQAVTASYPQLNRSSRGQILPSHWENELQKSIAQSKRNSFSFDASKRHPVFAASSLATKAVVVHPAATDLTYDVSVRHPVFFGSMTTACDNVHPAMGESSQTEAKEVPSSVSDLSCDVAVRHPVFFGSMTSTTRDVHPAIYGLPGAVSPQLLWSKPFTTTFGSPKPMWSPSTVPVLVSRSATPEILSSESESRRQQSRLTSDELVVDAEFGKQGMWNRREAKAGRRSSERDWLDDSMKKRFLRIELRY